jgi:hypothetical protein
VYRLCTGNLRRLGFEVTLAADTDNRRVHGYLVPDFTESLAVMLDEGGEEQLAMSRFAVVSSVIEFGKLAFGRDAKGCGFFHRGHSMALVVSQ